MERRYHHNTRSNFIFIFKNIFSKRSLFSWRVSCIFMDNWDYTYPGAVMERRYNYNTRSKFMLIFKNIFSIWIVFSIKGEMYFHGRLGLYHHFNLDRHYPFHRLIIIIRDDRGITFILHHMIEVFHSRFTLFHIDETVCRFDDFE